MRKKNIDIKLKKKGTSTHKKKSKKNVGNVKKNVGKLKEKNRQQAIQCDLNNIIIFFYIN
jgi:hypothetical protein